MAYSVLGKTQLMISLALKRPSVSESSSWSNFSFSANNQVLSFDCPDRIFKWKRYLMHGKLKIFQLQGKVDLYEETTKYMTAKEVSHISSLGLSRCNIARWRDTYSLLGATHRLNSIESKRPSPLVSNSESNMSFCFATSTSESKIYFQSE